MLVITRRTDEPIHLYTAAGEKVTIVVKKVRRRQVQLGIQAPHTIDIVRAEVDENDTEVRR